MNKEGLKCISSIDQVFSPPVCRKVRSLSMAKGGGRPWSESYTLDVMSFQQVPPVLEKDRANKVEKEKIFAALGPSFRNCGCARFGDVIDRWRLAGKEKGPSIAQQPEIKREEPRVKHFKPQRRRLRREARRAGAPKSVTALGPIQPACADIYLLDRER